MALNKVFIPYGSYWSSPFCRWQGALGNDNALQLAASSTKRFLSERRIAADSFDGLVLGTTVPQHHAFYGAAWLAGMIGAPNLTGPTVAQACATSVRVLATAAAEIETGQAEAILGVTCDRTSNGPHLVYPSPNSPGGTVETEDWVMDNFGKDPYAGAAMVQTAENVAKAAGISREAQDEITALRYEQYENGLEDDRAFQRRYMLAAEVRRGKKTIEVEADEGIHPTNLDGLRQLRPVLPEGSVTFGTQTHPADGNAGMIVCSETRAKQLARDATITVKILGFGSARVDKAMMPMAVVPAANRALAAAGKKLADIGAFTSHNPFAVNDLYFCKETGVDPSMLNRHGSPLIYGHPQAPTGTRAVIELIEELQMAGGGIGLFTGCAAGDTAMALVLEVR